MGRPSSYTPEIGEQICERIASGDSVRKAAESLEIDQSVIFRWLAANPQFREQYMRARESRADARFEQADEIMRDLRAGEIDPNTARVLLDAVKWQTGKEAPKKYGDRLELAGDKDAPIQTRVVIEVVDSPKGES